MVAGPYHHGIYCLQACRRGPWGASWCHLRCCGFADDLPLPVRHLDAFQLCQVGDLGSMEPLEDVDGVSEGIVAQGQVIPADAVAAGTFPCHPALSSPDCASQ